MTVKDLERLKNAGLIRGYSQVEVINNPKKPKFGNIKTTIDGIVFDSAKEAKRYVELRYLQMVGEISELELQVPYELQVNGKKVASYVCDFKYKRDGETIVEDCKSPITKKHPVYRLKKKLMKSVHGIDIQEY